MINFISSSLEGDGIHPDFFHRLWIQNRNDKNSSVQRTSDELGESMSGCGIRIPDTVIFRLGQPLQWYFIHERNKRVSILKKRKKNLSVEKIEQVFMRKAKASVGENLTEHDIVAYFVASSECTSRNRANDGGSIESMSCDIEYLNAEKLHDFLHTRRKNQSGILQRFIHPSGGEKNSQIQALCTSKMCILERRRNKQNLRDARFGLYERAVTFEGPEPYSTPLPIRGKALSGVIQELCYQVIQDISSSCDSPSKDEIRMVLNLKMDENEKVWILYSSSIRYVAKSKTDDEENLLKAPAQRALIKKSSLNMDQIITLAPSVKLREFPNHDHEKVLSNEKLVTTCPSCNRVENSEHFQPVLYKTIMSHFERVMEINGKEKWPPSEDVIHAAGNIGFGSIKNESMTLCKGEELLIPPVLRALHPRLGIDGYRRYRADSLFLHKECKMCESCFLKYAELVSSSFQIMKPIVIRDNATYSAYIGSSKRKSSKSQREIASSSTPPNKTLLNTIKHHEKISTIFSDLVIQGPILPSAIINPPAMDYESNIKKFLPLKYDEIETPKQPLIHLIQLEAAKKKSKHKVKERSENVNPYQIPLKLIDDRSTKKRRKMGRGFIGTSSVLSNHGKDQDNHLSSDYNQSRQNEKHDIIGILSNALANCASTNGS